MDFPAMPKDDHAKLLMASEEARLLLPKVRLIVRFPVLTLRGDQVRLITSGYDPETQILVWRGLNVPDVPLAEAVQSILELFAEYEFETPSDLSRAVSALLTPALRLGEHIKKRVPVFVVEANDSQAGKGYLLELIAAVYGEVPRLVTRREGGVGSVDESFDQRLLEGAPFIVFDNVRGKINSQHLEGFITSPGDFSARVPHREAHPSTPTCTSSGLPATERS